MTGEVLASGEVGSVNGAAYTVVSFDGGNAVVVTKEQGEIARQAQEQRKRVEIIGGVKVSERVVRIVEPVVVVHHRGRVDLLRDDGSYRISLRGMQRAIPVDLACLRVAARAMADDVEVEVVSIDGGPDHVRVCK